MSHLTLNDIHMKQFPNRSKTTSNLAMLIITMIFIAVFTTCSLQLQAQEGKIEQLMENYDIPDDYKGFTEERFLRSMITDNTFKLYIHLPLTYNTSEISYPILIMTDACFTMGIAETTFDIMSMHKELPETIIVGIDYPYSNMVDFVKMRFRDQMPTRVDGWEPAGGADNFINFIEKELFPYLEINYRVDKSDRCFYGHSGGGLLGSHILLEKPYLFNKYLIGSSSYWWDDKEIINRLRNKETLDLNGNHAIYTFIGSEEGESMINNWRTFNEELTSKLIEDVHFKARIFEGETHISVSPAAFSTGIKFLYQINKR